MRIRRRVRNVLVSMVSAAVLIGAGVFLLAPTEVAFATTVESRAVKGSNVTVYGTVRDLRGRGLRSYRVVLYHYTNPHVQHIDAVVRTKADGTYSVTKRFKRGRYYLQISDRGNTQRAHRRIAVAPGHAIRVDARETQRRPYFVMFPLFAY